MKMQPSLRRALRHRELLKAQHVARTDGRRFGIPKSVDSSAAGARVGRKQCQTARPMCPAVARKGHSALTRPEQRIKGLLEGRPRRRSFSSRPTFL